MVYLLPLNCWCYLCYNFLESYQSYSLGLGGYSLVVVELGAPFHQWVVNYQCCNWSWYTRAAMVGCTGRGCTPTSGLCPPVATHH